MTQQLKQIFKGIMPDGKSCQCILHENKCRMITWTEAYQSVYLNVSKREEFLSRRPMDIFEMKHDALEVNLDPDQIVAQRFMIVTIHTQ